MGKNYDVQSQDEKMILRWSLYRGRYSSYIVLALFEKDLLTMVSRSHEINKNVNYSLEDEDYFSPEELEQIEKHYDEMENEINTESDKK